MRATTAVFRQGVVHITVEGAGVGRAPAGGLAVDQIIQAYLEEVGDREQLAEAGQRLLADVL